MILAIDLRWILGIMMIFCGAALPELNRIDTGALLKFKQGPAIVLGAFCVALGGFIIGTMFGA